MEKFTAVSEPDIDENRMNREIHIRFWGRAGCPHLSPMLRL